MKFAPGFVIPILSGSFVFAAIYNSDGSIVATDTSQASVQAAVNAGAILWAKVLPAGVSCPPRANG
jgi:hypothetical protein